MKGTIACIVAVCSLALASGAAVNSASQVKTYTYNEGEIIHSLTPFRNDELLYAVCEKVKGVKNCKVYLESTNPAKSTVQTCDIKLNYTNRIDFSVILTNAGNSKAVFAERDGDTKIKLISLNLNGCAVHEAIVGSTADRWVFPHSSIVVPHLDGTKYDFFYRNEWLCHDLLCKATFDYEGKLLKAATPFPIHFLADSFTQIAFDNGAYIVAQNKRLSSNVIFVKENGTQLEDTTLFSGNQRNTFIIGFSTAANRFGFCTINDGKVVCQQYDVEGKKKLVEHTFQKDASADSIRYLEVLNLEKGFLAVTSASLKYKYEITVAHVDEQGKEGKVVPVDTECEDHIAVTNLYKAANGEYCINSICMPTYDTSDRSQFTRFSRCFLQTELF